MIVRRALEGDSAVLLAWRNDPQTRANSLQQGAVSEEEHEAWFAAKLEDPTTEIWIGEEDATPIGQVRLDLEEGDVAVVDIAVAPDRRGQGLGIRLLEMVVTQQSLPARRMRAVVRRENAASRALFETAGFEEVADSTECVVLERLLAHPGD